MARLTGIGFIFKLENMTNKNLFACLLFILFSNLVYAQKHEPCAYDFATEMMEKKYPGYKEAVTKTIQKAKAKGLESRNSNMVYKVPVVIHIVWKEAEENLTDELIASQMEVLNEDYRRLNPNANETRAIFEDVVGDPMIEFELVETVRTQTGNEFSLDFLTGALPDNVKSSSSGGSDAWDTESYLNIWICKIQPIQIGGLNLGQLLGYAYPPAGLDNWPEGVNAPSPELEGVVLDYRTIGRDSPFTIDPGLGMEIQLHGRAATHEVGHYLGLLHIWGIQEDPFGVDDTCDSDDGMDDTPNAGSQSAFDCDHTRNTCNSGTDDMLDMVENFMDYSNEACQNSFTNDQIATMRGVLEGPRCALVGLCDPTSTTDTNLDLEIDIFPNPAKDFIYVNSEREELKIISYSIYSYEGKEIRTQQIINQQLLNIANLSSGVYYIRFNTEIGYSTKSFIKE